jgi:hypothetical protein
MRLSSSAFSIAIADPAKPNNVNPSIIVFIFLQYRLPEPQTQSLKGAPVK